MKIRRKDQYKLLAKISVPPAIYFIFQFYLLMRFFLIKSTKYWFHERLLQCRGSKKCMFTR